MNQRAAAIIIQDNQILLIRRVKEGRLVPRSFSEGGGEYWVFPGGGVEEGETPEQAMEREVQEELSLQVTEYKFLFDLFNEFTMGGVYPPRQEFYYLVTRFSGEVKLGGEEAERMNEADQYYPTWVPLSQVKQMTNLKPEIAQTKLVEILQLI